MVLKTKKEDVRHYAQMSELNDLKQLVNSVRVHGDELEKDMREARTLLFVALVVLMALFGLLLGIAVRMIF